MSKNLEFTLRRFVLAPEPIIAAAHTKACLVGGPRFGIQLQGK